MVTILESGVRIGVPRLGKAGLANRIPAAGARRVLDAGRDER